MNSTSLGKLIKLLRERKKMTQENLAHMLNVSSSTVCKWEKGNNLPDVNMFKKIHFYHSFHFVLLRYYGNLSLSL